jgi:hypothetical protein
LQAVRPVAAVAELRSLDGSAYGEITHPDPLAQRRFGAACWFSNCGHHYPELRTTSSSLRADFCCRISSGVMHFYSGQAMDTFRLACLDISVIAFGGYFLEMSYEIFAV